MNPKPFLFLSLLFVVAVEANYDFTDKGKRCVIEIGSDEDTMKRMVMTDTGKMVENDITEKFCGCCMNDFINDGCDLIVDDNLMDYVMDICKIRIDKGIKLAKLMAKDCIEHCKLMKGDTKDKTAWKAMDCILERIEDLKKED